MQIMAPPGADNPDLAAFRDAGGKMMIYHGVADPVFSVNDTANWCAKLDANGGGAAEFARFYPVPGMNHCHGGPAADAFDLLTPLIAWVEQGTAPEPAHARAENEDLPEALQTATRPLCAAPPPRATRPARSPTPPASPARNDMSAFHAPTDDPGCQMG